MRSTQDVIHQAIRENRIPEYMLYVFACLFVLAGITLICSALLARSSLEAVVGVALNGLSWLAYRATRAIRGENLMLRMLEVPLMKARTADEAAKMLTVTFGHQFKAASSGMTTGKFPVQS